MQNEKNKDELEKEIALKISALGNYDATSNEYKAELEALSKLARVLEPLNKQMSDEIRTALEEKKFEQEVKNRKAQATIEKEKLHNDVHFNEEHIAIEKTKIYNEERFNGERIGLEKDRLSNEIAFKNKELELKEKSDKRMFWVALAGTVLPATISIVSNIIAMRYYNRLAIRALNMEYIDNSIAPRSYNECMNNINKFVSKK